MSKILASFFSYYVRCRVIVDSDISKVYSVCIWDMLKSIVLDNHSCF